MCAGIALSSEDTLHRRLSIAGWLLAMTLPSVAVGQVVRDDSLSDPGPVLWGTDINGETATYLIDPSYEPQGGNLYHSFSEFSIQEGETAQPAGLRPPPEGAGGAPIGGAVPRGCRLPSRIPLCAAPRR